MSTGLLMRRVVGWAAQHGITHVRDLGTGVLSRWRRSAEITLGVEQRRADRRRVAR